MISITWEYLLYRSDIAADKPFKEFFYLHFSSIGAINDKSIVAYLIWHEKSFRLNRAQIEYICMLGNKSYAVD